MREAFTYMFKDKCLWEKAGLYFFILILANIFTAFSETQSYLSIRPDLFSTNPLGENLLYIVTLFLYTLLTGYFISLTTAIIKQNTNIVLPRFNIGLNFVKALKYLLAITLIAICYFIVVLTAETFLGKTYSDTLIIIIKLFYSIYGIAFFWNFANNNDILTFFDFKNTFKYVAKAPKNYIKYLLIIGLIIILGSLLTVIIEYIMSFISSNILAILLFAFISTTIETYIAFSTSYLIARSIKIETVV